MKPVSIKEVHGELGSGIERRCSIGVVSVLEQTAKYLACSGAGGNAIGELGDKMDCGAADVNSITWPGTSWD